MLESGVVVAPIVTVVMPHYRTGSFVKPPLRFCARKLDICSDC